MPETPADAAWYAMALDPRLTAREARIAVLTAELANLREAHALLTREHDALVAEMAAMTRHNIDMRQEVLRATAAAAEAGAALQEIRASRAWRLVGHLRTLARPLVILRRRKG